MAQVKQTDGVQPTDAVAKPSFFFATEVPYGLALMRMILPWTLMTNIIDRWGWVRELYSADGAPAALADNFGVPHFLPELPGSVTVALFALLAFCLVTTSIGWCTRFSVLCVSVLYSYFGLLDSISTITKYTVIFAHLTLLLGVSQCGAVWSVDSWLRRRRGLPAGGAGPQGLAFPIWSQRLMQLFLGAMYFGAALTKMHTPAFFSGDQLMYWMMTYVNNVHPLGDWLSQFPLLLSVFGYIAITWEVVFLFTVFHPRFKWSVLAVGAMFHIMTLFTLGLFIFPAVMLASYLCFLNEDEVRRMLALPIWRGKGQRLLVHEATEQNVSQGAGLAPQPAWAVWRMRASAMGAFGVVAAALCLGAVEVEHWMDPYQMRGPNGPLPLRELSDAEVDALFELDKPVRRSDKLLAFDLGTKVVGEHLLNRRREFRQGDRIIAQVTLCPPHEDMWIDCLLNEAQPGAGDVDEFVPGKLVHKGGQIVPRESYRGNFWFLLDEATQPGEYFLRLKSGNEEIARRRFTLLPRMPAPMAN